MKVIGLTGGVASGKSTVANLFAGHGAAIIDTDHIARELLTTNPDLQKKVRGKFGTLDRAEIRKKIFSDPPSRTWLEALLHPMIREIVGRNLETLRGAPSPPALAIVVVPLLFETGWDAQYKGSIITVAASEKNQMARLIKRDRIPEHLATQMMATQLPMAEKRRRATFVIENSGDLSSLESEVSRVLDLILKVKTPGLTSKD